jgi:hypothetical protein
LKMAFGFREPIFEIKDYPIVGVKIEFAYLIKSMILDKLVELNAVTITYEIDGIPDQTNAGIIHIDQRFELTYYTGKGIREMWKTGTNDEEVQHAKHLKKQSEDYLIANHYISKLPFDAILKVE